MSSSSPFADELVRFRLGQPHRGYVGRVEQYSTLHPLTLGCRPGQPRRSLHSMVEAVIARNRRTLLDWRQEVGDAFHSTYLRMANCPPAFVKSTPSKWPCRDFWRCPHCWARRAAESWQAVDLLLFPPSGDGSRPETAVYDLVRLVRVFPIRALMPYWVGGRPDLPAVLADRCSDRKSRHGLIPARGHELRGLPFPGVLDLTVVDIDWEAGKDRPVGAWRIEVRQLFAVKPGAPFSFASGRNRRISSGTRKQVANMVARFWKFPRGFLQSCTPGFVPPVKWADKFEKARKGRRLFAARGVFKSRPTLADLELLTGNTAAGFG